MVALQKADTNLDEVVNDVNNLVNCTHCHGPLLLLLFFFFFFLFFFFFCVCVCVCVCGFFYMQYVMCILFIRQRFEPKSVTQHSRPFTIFNERIYKKQTNYY